MISLERVCAVAMLATAGLLAPGSLALSSVQTSQALQDSEIAALVARGDDAFASGDYERAVSAYIRISPVEVPVEAQNRLAISYQRLGMLPEAEALYRVALAREGEYAPANNNLGTLYYIRADYKDAEGRFRDALRYAPGDPVIEQNLHEAKYAREHDKLVRDQVARLIEDGSSLLEADTGEVLEVKSLIEPAVQEELGSLILRGDIFVARKLFEDAIVEYERFLEIDGFDPRVHNKLGITYQQIQRTSDAEGEYRKALRLNPYFVPALNNLGSIEQSRQNYVGALDYYRRALAIDQDSATVMQNLGSCLFAMERYEEGLVAYIAAIQLDPSLFDRIGSRGGTLVQTTPGNESMTNFYLAKLFASSGDLDRSMSFLYRAVEEGFDDPAKLEDPAFAGLASDERFVQLVASLNESF